ncbi:hypothetical protein P7K49_011299 [Saguinus oedipus]|uniref:Mitochondrial splicing suppressor 51-like C-terminal domain-containing protein n=1 Tax=Saguinus oedipus TaxID=9490 RepID=A0ABQ9VQA1_SAGOE|nr:hypothetical protein P7K49_011299 [Saguinus oedipus]
MAVLLTYPLTVYYVITYLVPQSFPELNIQNKQSLKIHVVEAGKEFDLVMVFWELLVLLPHVALELQFVGDGLTPESDQQHFTLQRVRAEGALLFSPDPSSDLLDSPEVSVRNGSGISARPSSGTKEKGSHRDLQIKVSARPYHLLQGPKPDLVIGFNSGFGLKDTWLSSLPRLQVGNGGKRELLSPPARPLLISFSESLRALLCTITCSTGLGNAHGSLCPSLCLLRASSCPPPPPPPPDLSRGLGFQPCLSSWLLGWIWRGISQSESCPTQSLRVPAFFTESSEYGCVMDGQTMAVATGGGTSRPQVNPFRSPFRLRAADDCMPWGKLRPLVPDRAPRPRRYCNAFIFHLVYKPTQGSRAHPTPGPAPPSPTPSLPPARTRRRRGEKKPGRGTRRRR